MQNPKLEKKFQLLDKNGDGVISRNEFARSQEKAQGGKDRSEKRKDRPQKR
jgi:Ca2+-binding EF-hand superfamily protein